MFKYWTLIAFLLSGCSYQEYETQLTEGFRHGALMLNLDCNSKHYVYLPTKNEVIHCRDKNYHMNMGDSVVIDISKELVDGIYFERIKFFVQYTRETALMIIARDDQVIYFDDVDFSFNGALLVNSKGLIHIVSTDGGRVNVMYDGGSVSARNIQFYSNLKR